MGLRHALEVAKKLPEAQLLIAGTGSMESELSSQIEELDLVGRAHLLGRVPNEQLPDVFRAGDVTLVPSLALEGFGLVVLESMACGTPVVATRVGGLPEAMGPFADNYCVDEAFNVEAMVHLARAAIDVGEPLAVAVRNFAQKRSLKTMAHNVERVVEGAHHALV